MRIRTPWIMIFTAFIMVASSLTLYYYVERKVEQEVELRILNKADNLLIDIEQDQDKFIRNPAAFIFSPKGNEFTSSGILVQYNDSQGKVLAKSPGLKRNSLPYIVGEDDLIRDVVMSDGTDLKIYQRSIEFNGRDLGYLEVAVPTAQMYNTVKILRVILAVVMFCTVIILGFGISAIVSFDTLRNQRKFLSFASHELRTPLAVISGHAEVALREKNLPKNCGETLKEIKDEADWMGRLVSSLLLTFRSQMGVQRLKKQRFNLGELVADCASTLKILYPKKQITLNLPEEAQIRADHDLIKILITNLLENAAKNTKDNGHIWVDLSANPGNFTLTVRDNGLGIKKELQKDIFKAFYQVKQGSGGGVGLGLSITKWIVDAHNGKIDVESPAKGGAGESGKGSTFKVSLPR